MTWKEFEDTPWMSVPLVMRLVICMFNTAICETGVGLERQQHAIHWALGWFKDGECVQIGAWVEPSGCTGNYEWTIQNLKDRGLERIRLVTGHHIDRLHECLAVAFSPLTATSLVDKDTPTELPRVWRRLAVSRKPEEENLRARLKRDIRRHGPFDTLEDAIALVGAAVKQVEVRRERALHREMLKRWRAHVKEVAASPVTA
jgi:hypothetical protein